MRARRRMAALRTLLCAGVAACTASRRTAVTSPTADVRTTEHCWWSTNRTALSPDSVVSRFQRAFSDVGLDDAVRGSLGDTVWLQSTERPLGDSPAAGRYAMHVVAYGARDSTRYRYFLSTLGAPRTSVAPGRALIALCAAVAREAAIPGTQPAQPTGEEAAAVWRWRPQGPFPHRE